MPDEVVAAGGGRAGLLRAMKPSLPPALSHGSFGYLSSPASLQTPAWQHPSCFKLLWQPTAIKARPNAGLTCGCYTGSKQPDALVG